MAGRILLFVLLVVLMGCNQTKKVPMQDNVCDQLGTVKDFTGLDGCKLLVVHDNGDKFLPGKISVPGFELRDGQRLKFSYELFPEGMSTCMAEKAIINITCAEEIPLTGKPPKPECVNTTDPHNVTWMRSIITKERPLRIYKYDYLDGWAYFFMSAKRNALFDCQGNFLCDVQGKMMNDCVRRIDNLRGKELIWSGSEYNKSNNK